MSKRIGKIKQYVRTKHVSVQCFVCISFAFMPNCNLFFIEKTKILVVQVEIVCHSCRGSRLSPSLYEILCFLTYKPSLCYTFSTVFMWRDRSVVFNIDVLVLLLGVVLCILSWGNTNDIPKPNFCAQT